jgi:hypothetical protein
MSNERSEGMTMDTKGFVVPPGGGSVLNMAPGRSAALKLLGGETGDSIMLFEETAPVGTDTTFHLRHDSDEVAYVLRGEITFKIGEEVTVGGRAPAPSYRAVCRMPGKTPAPKPAVCCFSTRRPGPAGFSKNGWACRVDQWRRGQRNTSAPRLGDHRSAAFLA